MTEDEEESARLEGIELTKALIGSWLADPEDSHGRLGRLLVSLREDLVRELPDDRAALLEELDRRSRRVMILVGAAVATVVVPIIRAAERAGFIVDRKRFASVYDVLDVLSDS